MPAARTASGSPSWAATRETTSAGTSRPDSSAILLIWPRIRDRHDPREDRDRDARRASALDEAEVVRGAEEHLGDRELRAGVLLGLEHLHVRVEARRLAVSLGERRDADEKLPSERTRATSSLA
jgi:hypothetical protein